MAELGQMMTDSASVFVWISNTEKECTYFNKSWLLFRGRKLEEEIGLGWADGVHPDDCDRRLATFAAAFDERRPFSMDYRLRRFDDQYRWIRDNGSPYFTADGEFKGYIGSCFDITELRELQDHLRHVEKIDALGELAGGVAHDFNNQLAGILGYADLLSGSLTDPKLKDYATRIKNTALRSADLTEKLLVLSRKRKRQSVPTDVHQAVEETVDILAHSLNKLIRVHCDLGADQSIVIGDPSPIQNVILNLALNARDAMPKGGDLTFETRIVRLQEDSDIAIANGISRGDYVEIAVSDTGSGMSDEVRSRLFEPFFTTKEEGKGTGMGLASAFGTIRQHKGCIVVHSELGKGTRIEVLLPLAIPEEKLKNGNEAPAAEIIRGPLSILLVDDELTVRQVVANILTQEKHAVKAAVDGNDALDQYRLHWQDIDLVILDMIMPNLDGLATFRAMKKINPDVRVLLCTGWIRANQLEKMVNEGIRGFISKPFTRKDLLLAVEKAMAAVG